MNVNPDEWLAFQTVSEELNFGRAALRLHISQPALTKQIKRLETKLDGALFSRTTSHVRLTPAGETLLEPTRRFLAEGRYLTRLASDAMRGEAGTLRVGFGIAVLADLLPRAVKRFRKTYPNVTLEMRDMASLRQIDALRSRSIDLGFVRLPIEDATLDAKSILQEKLLIAASTAEAAQVSRKLGGWRHAPFVVIARRISPTFYNHIVRVCEAAGFTPKIALEVSELFTVLNLVRAGLGISLVPASARRMRIPGVRYLDTGQPEASWTIGMVHRRDSQSLLCDHFKRCVQEEAA